MPVFEEEPPFSPRPGLPEGLPRFVVSESKHGRGCTPFCSLSLAAATFGIFAVWGFVMSGPFTGGDSSRGISGVSSRRDFKDTSWYEEVAKYATFCR
jgi:hypothetical protein